MKIIATTTGGFLIEASKKEVTDILTATIGQVPENIGVSTIIPAHDYAAKVRECKSFKESTEYKNLKYYAEKSSEKILSLISNFEKLND